MSLPKKELVVNVLQTGKQEETVQIRIQSGELDNDVEMAESNEEGPTEAEGHADLIEIRASSYDEHASGSDEIDPTCEESEDTESKSGPKRLHDKYKHRWSDSWLEKPEFQGWLTKNEATRNAHCLYCKRDVKGSRSMLERHAKTLKHMDNSTGQGPLLYKQTTPKIPMQSIRYVIEPSDGVTFTNSEPLLLVPQDGGQTNAVFVNSDGSQLESDEGFHNVIEPDEDYVPCDENEIYVTVGRTETFSASHRLHSSELTPFKNQEIFGKCNYPNGHGHNYKFTVDITGPKDKATGMVINLADLKKLIRSNILEILDHKNLDKDVPYFKTNVSTVENIAFFIWKQLRPVIDEKHHIRITVNETDKNKATFPALL